MENMIVRIGDEEIITFYIRLEVIKLYIVCEGRC